MGKFKKQQQGTNNNYFFNKVETSDHYKNGAIPKSQTSRTTKKKHNNG